MVGGIERGRGRASADSDGWLCWSRDLSICGAFDSSMFFCLERDVLSGFSDVIEIWIVGSPVRVCGRSIYSKYQDGDPDIKANSALPPPSAHDGNF